SQRTAVGRVELDGGRIAASTVSLGLSFLSQIAWRDRSIRHGVIGAHLPKCARFGKGRKMVVVIAECLAQNIIGMFAEPRCGYRVDHRGQALIERDFVIGTRPRSRVLVPVIAT